MYIFIIQSEQNIQTIVEKQRNTNIYIITILTKKNILQQYAIE